MNLLFYKMAAVRNVGLSNIHNVNSFFRHLGFKNVIFNCW